MALEPLRATLYSTLGGSYLRRIPLSKASWTKEVNGWGKLDATVPRSVSANLPLLRSLVQEWRTLLVFTRGSRVIHAGPVTARPFDTNLTVKAEGFGAIYRKRLVLNRLLGSMPIDGEILIDEDNPAPEWVLTFTGSYVDIAAQLVEETQIWGPLPVMTPARTGGSMTRTYYGYDLATVAERLLELSKLENGPELRFSPRLVPGGIMFDLEGSAELVNKHHRWNTDIPGDRCTIGKIDSDGDAVVSQQWMLGGRNEDIMLMTRQDDYLDPLVGYPLLQEADTSHSTVSEIETLRAYGRDHITRGARTQEVIDVTVSAEEDVEPGDWADVRTSHPLYGKVVLPLKVLTVSGDESDRIKLSCRIRNGENV